MKNSLLFIKDIIHGFFLIFLVFGAPLWIPAVVVGLVWVFVRVVLQR